MRSPEKSDTSEHESESSDDHVTVYTWPGNVLSSEIRTSKVRLGHSALRTYSDGPTNEGIYASFYPGTCDRENRHPSCQETRSHFHKSNYDDRTFAHKTDLYGLNVEAINNAFQDLHDGNLISIKEWSERHNCSNVVLDLLETGGLYRGIGHELYGRIKLWPICWVLFFAMLRSINDSLDRLKANAGSDIETVPIFLTKYEGYKGGATHKINFEGISESYAIEAIVWILLQPIISYFCEKTMEILDFGISRLTGAPPLFKRNFIWKQISKPFAFMMAAFFLFDGLGSRRTPLIKKPFPVASYKTLFSCIFEASYPILLMVGGVIGLRYLVDTTLTPRYVQSLVERKKTLFSPKTLEHINSREKTLKRMPLSDLIQRMKHFFTNDKRSTFVAFGLGGLLLSGGLFSMRKTSLMSEVSKVLPTPSLK